MSRERIEPAAGSGGSGEDPGELRVGVRPLIDLSNIDLSSRLFPRETIETLIPHRGAMSLLDWIVWESSDYRKGVGLKHIRDDEFWVPGHFPGRPMFPGVLMIETGAQLACYLFNRRRPEPKVVAFLRIENASFRTMVEPGDDLYVICSEVKFGRRSFKTDAQGMVGDRIAFDAHISGMQL